MNAAIKTMVDTYATCGIAVDVWATTIQANYPGDVEGLENIPSEGPVLLVGNHSGGTLIADGQPHASAADLQRRRVSLHGDRDGERRHRGRVRRAGGLSPQDAKTSYGSPGPRPPTAPATG